MNLEIIPHFSNKSARKNYITWPLITTNELRTELEYNATELSDQAGKYNVQLQSESTECSVPMFLRRGRIACNAERCIRHGISVRLLHAGSGTISTRMKIGSGGARPGRARTNDLAERL